MIDTIGGKGAPGRADFGRGQIGKTGAAKPVADLVSRPGAGALSSTVLALAAEGAPVDATRIAAIRAAISTGQYPIDPDRIADRMMALDLPARR